MQYRVSYGDGGFSELQSAIRIHGNAVEYIPIALILLLFMEMDGAQTRIVHVCGLLLIAGRLMHYYGYYHRLFRWRRSGMSATLVFTGADGAGKPVVYALGSWFSPCISAQYAPLFSRIFTLCLTATRFFPRLSPDWATGLLMNG